MANDITIATYDNPVEANIARGKLENENIPCYLTDENTVSTNWLWNNAIGGIKLMVDEKNSIIAREILSNVPEEIVEILTCPSCSSGNIQELYSKRGLIMVFKFLIVLLLGVFMVFFKRGHNKINHKYRCLNCNHIFRFKEIIN